MPTTINNYSSIKEGMLLEVIVPEGLQCEETIGFDTSGGWRRVQAWTKKSAYVKIPCGGVVLCIENTVHPDLGIRKLRFLYDQKMFTMIGYYLPEWRFKVISIDSGDTNTESS